MDAIGGMQTGRAPGSDGLPADFYKLYRDILAPVLLDLYEESREKGSLPPTLREALVVSLLKPDKPPAECDSYRPLSLLNCDAKILAKLLANRLSLLLPRLFKPDQSGFIPQRSTSHNLRTLFAVMQDIDPDLDAAAIFLDATKAFESLEWGFLHRFLTSVGVSRWLLEWIRLLYSATVARLEINGTISEPFPLTRGTRQGCPLSPLLFQLLMEPLAARLWQRHMPPQGHSGLHVCRRRDVVPAEASLQPQSHN